MMRALGDEIEVASVIRALRDAQDSIDRLGLEPKVRRLVRIRTSQINGCEPCIRLNVDAAASEDETRLRIDGLAAWRSMEAYLPDERAALAWCEALTRPSERPRQPDRSDGARCLHRHSHSERQALRDRGGRRAHVGKRRLFG